MAISSAKELVTPRGSVNPARQSIPASLMELCCSLKMYRWKSPSSSSFSKRWRLRRREKRILRWPLIAFTLWSIAAAARPRTLSAKVVCLHLLLQDFGGKFKIS